MVVGVKQQGLYYRNLLNLYRELLLIMSLTSACQQKLLLYITEGNQ